MSVRPLHLRDAAIQNSYALTF